jgi:hypothetical protein
MSVLLDENTFNKAFDELVLFRITALNVNGWSQTSESNQEGAKILTVPRFMNTATRDVSTND